ncbi:MAG: DUF1385 domain-containing protein [Candidatus Marinimicrobia bacterium]|nr:DUF1385 domain-containing protein [Candidatus Neomarinimicrobiota bacterium]MBL7059875.1 DUF1385 domain-containing protein [Candidatus Neomarinimicrobiota bacterium]
MKQSILITLMKPSILVGGQAVIEGVMMRVPGAYATAVRDPKGQIKLQRHEFTSVTEKSRFWKRPIFRGMASLYEAMKMGMKTLQWSADVAMPEEAEKEPSKIADWLSMVFAIVLALVLFMIAPYWITTHVLGVGKQALLFNVAAGAMRISFFLLYLFIISMLKDVKRLFQYHGAEHKVVYNFESGKDINIKNAQNFPTPHPRCGTSFMFIVLVSAILVFAILDTLVIAAVGNISLAVRLGMHLPFIPLVAGVGYEVIKLTSKNESILFRILRKPGLWLQNITTKQPDDDMVEVAITSLQSAFGERYEETTGQEYTAEAIG